MGNLLCFHWQQYQQLGIACRVAYSFVHFAANDVKADKLPLEMEPVACDNNMIFTLKPNDQIFVAPYSTDNCSSTNTPRRSSCIVCIQGDLPLPTRESL